MNVRPQNKGVVSAVLAKSFSGRYTGDSVLVSEKGIIFGIVSVNIGGVQKTHPLKYSSISSLIWSSAIDEPEHRAEDALFLSTTL